ncbi:hypothetical protein RHMOL_Rhmol06G0143500 [Rhododendron molle]|uniref:Uncharacterized protein n=1 Tax=Rhododendron molle TaxID=49168 RepID=A0ACC0NE94_RHOML|nr:hypothetical protein RHMOL_Rhmol06G0143500 [Rhododendron molle]
MFFRTLLLGNTDQRSVTLHVVQHPDSLRRKKIDNVKAGGCSDKTAQNPTQRKCKQERVIKDSCGDPHTYPRLRTSRGGPTTPLFGILGCGVTLDDEAREVLAAGCARDILVKQFAITAHLPSFSELETE